MSNIVLVLHVDMNRCVFSSHSRFVGQDKTCSSVLLWETLIAQFLIGGGGRSEFKVPEVISSQFRVIFVESERQGS